MTEQARPERVPHSNAYNIFILVLTILSLAIMVLLIVMICLNGVAIYLRSRLEKRA